MSKTTPLSPQTDQLSKDWARKWNEWQALVEHYRVDINRRRAGLVIDSSLPHLMALEDDVLSTGVVLYHLKVSRRVCPLSPSAAGPRGAGGKGQWQPRWQNCPQEARPAHQL